MNKQLILFCALALGHFVVASQKPIPFVAKGVFTSIIDAIIGSIMPLPHIVGGREVKPHSHPHQVALHIELDGGEQSFCGGSLIAPQWVLTAAHCTENANDIIAVLGAHCVSSLELSRQVMHVEKFIRHEKWNNRTYVNDIALLKLPAKANLDENVQTIRLSSLAFKDQSLSGMPVIMTGWGQFSDLIDTFSPVLRSAESIIISDMYCNLRYLGRIKRTMVCADGERRRGVCAGDSGGPLITEESDGQRTLIGVTSLGAKFGCEVGYPSVFTRVDRYLEWIANNTGIQLRE